MQETRRRPGPDSTLDDVRAKLIQAGIELLAERGVELGLGDITLSETINRAQVTRSTAYRSLADDEHSPQTVLQRELIHYLVDDYTRSTTRQGIGEAIDAELALHVTALESGDCRARSNAMRSIIRVGANTSYLGVIASQERAIITAIYGSVRSSPRPPDWRNEALIQGENKLTKMFTDFYVGLSDLFQYRAKPEYTLDQFTAAGASMLEGMAMRHGFNDLTSEFTQRKNTYGELEDWTLYAIAFEALFTGMCEPVDPVDPFADLLRY